MAVYSRPGTGITTTDERVDHIFWPCDHKRKPDGEMETCQEAERRRSQELARGRKGISIEEIAAQRGNR